MKINKIFLACALVLCTISLSGCGLFSDKEEFVTYYNEGVYAPADKTYSITMPTADYSISGEEDPNNITFEKGTYSINIQRFKIDSEETKDLIEARPSNEEKFLEYLKEEYGQFYTINDYKNEIFYNEKENYSMQKATASDESGKAILEYTLIDDNFYYLITAHSGTVEGVMKIEAYIKDMIVYNEKLEVKPFKLKEKSLSGNTYTSHNNDFNLTLPYYDWKFSFKQKEYSDVTTIKNENSSITITRKSLSDIGNTVIYETPVNILKLNKQIKIENESPDSLYRFGLYSVGMTLDENDTDYISNYTYLLKKNNTYKAYSEFKTESDMYSITGSITTQDKEKVDEFYNILRSFKSNY